MHRQSGLFVRRNPRILPGSRQPFPSHYKPECFIQAGEKRYVERGEPW